MQRVTHSVFQALEKICPGGVSRNVNLAQISWWRVGGEADVMIEPASVVQVGALRAFIARERLPSVVIGDTSNLLFSDEGLHAICIRIGKRMSSLKIEGTTVEAQAGIWVPHLARRLMKAGLSGVEHVCGIPGTLGGLICMNGGSQRKAIGESVLEVSAIDPSGKLYVFGRDACAFTHRESVFDRSGMIITGAKLQLKPVNDHRVIRREMRSILRERRIKFPRKQPNCGSVFKSDPAMYGKVGTPGAVIERFGLKGLSAGGALISTQHANFIVNQGNAKAADIISLVQLCSRTVLQETGFQLKTEVHYVSTGGQITSLDAMLF